MAPISKELTIQHRRENPYEAIRNRYKLGINWQS